MESFINALTSDTAIAIYALIGAGLTASGLTEFIKRKASLINKGVILFLLTTLSGLTVFVGQLIDFLTLNPSLLGTYTATVLGVATLVYRLPIKPVANYLHDVNEYSKSKKTVNKTVEVEAPLISDEAINLLVEPASEQATNKHAF